METGGIETEQTIVSNSWITQKNDAQKWPFFYIARTFSISEEYSDIDTSK